MKIIFSPSKSQQTDTSVFSTTTPVLFPKSYRYLIEIIQRYTPEAIKKIFRISNEKSMELLEAYNKKQTNTVAAIELFSGTSFRELHLQDYTTNQYRYLKDHVRILSALYGVLEPIHAVSSYRLDMNNNILKNTDYKNLYNFWEPEVTNYFTHEDIIINLASTEYSRMLQQIDTDKIITIHFLVEKDGKEKTIAVYAKQQRGKMLDYMITNMIHHPEKLQDYNNDGFIFDMVKSDALNYYFIKTID